MTEMLGHYASGYNIGGTGRHEVLRVVDPHALVWRERYEVVLEVDSRWQADVIVVILNAGKIP